MTSFGPIVVLLLLFGSGLWIIVVPLSLLLERPLSNQSAVRYALRSTAVASMAICSLTSYPGYTAPWAGFAALAYLGTCSGLQAGKRGTGYGTSACLFFLAVLWFFVSWPLCTAYLLPV